jgi:hypothetical protein
MCEIDKNYAIALLSRLTMREVLEVAQNCIDICAVTSVENYHAVLGTPKRTIYDRIKGNRISCLEIDGQKFPAINVF